MPYFAYVDFISQYGYLAVAAGLFYYLFEDETVGVIRDPWSLKLTSFHLPEVTIKTILLVLASVVSQRILNVELVAWFFAIALVPATLIILFISITNPYEVGIGLIRVKGIPLVTVGDLIGCGAIIGLGLIISSMDQTNQPLQYALWSLPVFLAVKLLIHIDSSPPASTRRR